MGVFCAIKDYLSFISFIFYSILDQIDPKAVEKVIRQEYENLGSIRLDEFLMLWSFIILVCLWFFQKPRFMPGWADRVESDDKDGNKVAIGAATPAFVMVLIVFALPKKNPFKNLNDPQPPGILTWELIQHKLQWGVIILLGGGFALSKGVKASGYVLFRNAFEGEFDSMKVSII